MTRRRLAAAAADGPTDGRTWSERSMQVTFAGARYSPGGDRCISAHGDRRGRFFVFLVFCVRVSFEIQRKQTGSTDSAKEATSGRFLHELHARSCFIKRDEPVDVGTERRATDCTAHYNLTNTSLNTLRGQKYVDKPANRLRSEAQSNSGRPVFPACMSPPGGANQTPGEAALCTRHADPQNIHFSTG